LNWHFPPTRFVHDATVLEQCLHVLEEAMESLKAVVNEPMDRAAEELWDVVHSGETALRILQRIGVDIYQGKKFVLAKNDKRGYYEIKK